MSRSRRRRRRPAVLCSCWHCSPCERTRRYLRDRAGVEIREGRVVAFDLPPFSDGSPGNDPEESTRAHAGS